MDYRNSSVLTAEDVANILKVSPSYAYKEIKALNDELNEKGYRTTHGRISTRYFCERLNIDLGGVY